MKKILVRVLWTLLMVGVFGAVLGFTAISEGWIGYMPPIDQLQNPINRYATQIYSADGKIMGTWNYNRENRVLVDYELLQETVSMRCLVVGIRNVANRNTLAAMNGPNPISIGEIDTDGRRGVLIASKHRRTNHVGCHTFHL